MGVRRKLFEGRDNISGGAKFLIDGTGTNEGAESKNRAAKSVNISMCLGIFKVILIEPFTVKN